MHTEKNLFDRLVHVYTEAQNLKEDMKAIKTDMTYDADNNPTGLDKNTVKLIDKAAKLYVAAKFEEVEQESLEVFEKYKELVGD